MTHTHSNTHKPPPTHTHTIETFPFLDLYTVPVLQEIDFNILLFFLKHTKHCEEALSSIRSKQELPVPELSGPLTQPIGIEINAPFLILHLSLNI